MSKVVKQAASDWRNRAIVALLVVIFGYAWHRLEAHESLGAHPAMAASYTALKEDADELKAGLAAVVAEQVQQTIVLTKILASLNRD